MTATILDTAADTVLRFDKRVRRAVLPRRDTLPVKAIDWVSKIGDQAQMRLVAGGVMLAGTVRRDAKMFGAGVRMLAAHELATSAKVWVKDRVVRTRPRNPARHGAHKPRKGHDTRKEKSSFPSGHAAGAAATTSAFAAVYPAQGLIARGAAGVVALGRVPACKHYPSDVVAGTAIGIAAAAVVGGAWALTRKAARLALA